MEGLEPKFAAAHTLRPDPERRQDRRERADPEWSTSSTLTLLPSRAEPYTLFSIFSSIFRTEVVFLIQTGIVTKTRVPQRNKKLRNSVASDVSASSLDHRYRNFSPRKPSPQEPVPVALAFGETGPAEIDCGPGRWSAAFLEQNVSVVTRSKETSARMNA